MRSFVSVLGAAMVLVLLACGAGAGGRLVQPKAITAAEALAETCPRVAERGMPLIVDLKSYERASFENAMAEHVAVVSYDCHALRLMPDCYVDGTYGVRGVSRKEDIVELKNADEIRANLPSLGGKLAIDLEAALERGASLDLAMVMIGTKRTTISAIRTANLHGACDGATHFVRGAFMGAFAMGTMTRGRILGAAQGFAAISLLKAGVEGQSTSEASSRNSDGDPAACQQVDASASSLPSGCSAILRLELAPIGTSPRHLPEEPELEATAEDASPSCPQGFIFSGGKCTQAHADTPRVCTVGSAACASACDAGDLGTCLSLARAYRPLCGAAQGKSGADQVIRFVATEDCKRGFDLARRACSGGSMVGCRQQGVDLMMTTPMGHLTAADDTEIRATTASANALYRKACDGGDDRSCILLAQFSGDREESIKLYERACDGGSPAACKELGKIYGADANGAVPDAKQAAALFRRACVGDDHEACDYLCKPRASFPALGAPDAAACAALERLKVTN